MGGGKSTRLKIMNTEEDVFASPSSSDHLSKADGGVGVGGREGGKGSLAIQQIQQRSLSSLRGGGGGKRSGNRTCAHT